MCYSCVWLGYVCWIDALWSAVSLDIPREVMCCSLCSYRVSQVKWYVCSAYLPGICLLKWRAVVCSFLGYPRGSDVLEFMFIQSIPDEVICLQCVLAWDIPGEVICCSAYMPGICLLKWRSVVWTFLGYLRGSDNAAVYVHPEYPRWSGMLQCVHAWDMSVEVTCCGLQFPRISQGKWYVAVCTCLGYVCWSDVLWSAVSSDIPGEVICCSLNLNSSP